MKSSFRSSPEGQSQCSAKRKGKGSERDRGKGGTPWEVMVYANTTRGVNNTEGKSSGERRR
jgi:hypothetical protein